MDYSNIILSEALDKLRLFLFNPKNTDSLSCLQLAALSDCYDLLLALLHSLEDES